MTREQPGKASRISLPHKRGPLLRITPSFGMMVKHACNIGTNRAKRSYAAFSVHSTIHQHRRLVDSRLADHVLRLRGPVLAIDQCIRNDRALGILSDARSQGPAEFQNHWNDLWSSVARREFLLFLQNRTNRLL